MTLRQIGQVTMVMFTLVPQFGHILEFREAQTGHPRLSIGRRVPQWMQNTGLSLAGGAWAAGGRGGVMGRSTGGALIGAGGCGSGAGIGVPVSGGF